MQKASKNFVANLKKQKRENKSLLFLDNVKIIKDALAKGTIQPECLLTSLNEEEFAQLGIDAVNHFGQSKRNLVETFSTDAKTIESLADTKTPQKVLCIAYLSQDVVVKPNTNFLVLDGLQDPGNVGTLIRTAKACGFEFVFLLDSVRKSNAKLIRSSVGAVFDNKVFEMSRTEFLEFAKRNKLKLVCTDMNGENIFNFTESLHKEHPCHSQQVSANFFNSAEDNKCWHAVEESQLLGVVVGNEGQGVSDEIAAICFKTVKIPMKEGIESLNAAVSGSIIMYEINKNGL